MKIYKSKGGLLCQIGGVTGKAALDITMGAISLCCGPVGWAIGGTYFIADAAGAFNSWSKLEQ